MFRKFTVFIVGAGAGVDLDMPTGEQLTEQISKKLDIRSEFGERKSGDVEIVRGLNARARLDGVDPNELFRIARGISKGIHHTKSIDNYCHTHRENPNVQKVAKIAIVQSILKAERASPLFVNQTKHPFVFRDENKVRRSWLQNFMQILQEGTNASTNLKGLFNNLIIFNFNYDRCVEHYLYYALQELYGIQPASAADLIEGLKIHHPYGRVGKLPWQEGAKRKVEFGASPSNDEADIAALSENIRTYNEEVAPSKNLRIFTTLMASADRFVFLGFHFHRQNIELIAAPVSELAVRHAYATTVGRSDSDLPIIEGRIRNMLPTRKEFFSHIEKKLDCTQLFREYGTTFEE